ncbi:MAG: hypothetical protein AAB342_05495, partial [Chloroflexota bacterium]
STTDRATLLDIKVIQNENIDSLGNAGKVTIYKYRSGDIELASSTYSGLIDVSVITTLKFDLRGNALEQGIARYSDKDLATVIETQNIISSYDFHDRQIHSSITTRNSLGLFVDRQEIDYLSYDLYGNVIDQTITRFNELDTPIDFKVIHNTYDNLVAARRGNATHSTITRYEGSSADPLKLIDRQEISNLMFDLIGNIVDQTIDLYVGELLSRETLIHNADISNRGDAKIQEITTYITDEQGTLIPQEASYQVIDNRTFDSDRNVLDQQVLNYLDSTKAVLLDMQEIRNESFDSRGNVLIQRIATYSTQDRATLLDIKLIQNEDLDSLGNAGKVTISKYRSGDIELSSSTYSGLIDVSVITTLKFDLRGNALEQEIARYSDLGLANIIETQTITSTYDFHDRQVHSSITTRNSLGLFVDRQEIEYLSYDLYGNVIDQTITRYDETDTAIDFKVIHNTYDNLVAARR